jgi:heme/copper-type cytochrome/quinol oxidase subunit 4
LSFRGLWITFDLHSVSLGLWLLGLLVIELLIKITMSNSHMSDFKRSLIFLALRLILTIVPFLCFEEHMKDIIFANRALGVIISLTYVEQLKLYNGHLISKIVNYVFVEN